MAVPSGTVTFLFTDIEGSTRLWQQDEAAMRAGLARHDEMLRSAVVEQGGAVFANMGDGIAAAFSAASAAVRAALSAQRAVEAEAWPTPTPIRVRMGLHTGEAEERGGDYFGTAVNRAARLMAVAHGGQVVCSSATAGVVDAEVALVDLGEHRLRDLDRPLRVFQVGGGSFDELRSLDAFPGNLPLQLTSFVGRDAEVAAIGDALAQSRLVTLTGVGGVGKTRLALQVAAEVVPQYGAGAWLAELAAVRDPEAVPDVLVAMFGLQPTGGLSASKTLAEFLRGKELLLVLDNCEHLLRAVARLVDEVVRGCPAVRVLATSREALNVAGERLLGVASLEVPPASASLATIAQCDAVALFVERARAAKASFTLDATNAEAVAQVCRRLDGIALAIELAAARIAMLTPAEVARRLDKRFRLLAGGQRTAVERHQTLRAAIDWSYELLSETEQLLLARLSVFAGGFSLEAAEAVTAAGGIDVDDVFELLATLVARSLVVADTEGIDTRYRLLETIRQYSQEHLDDGGDGDRLRTGHAAYHARFAETAIANAVGPDGTEWEHRFERESDNLRAALTWATDSGDVDTALSLLAMWDGPVMLNDASLISTTLWACNTVATIPGASEHPKYPAALAVAAMIAWTQSDQGLARRRCDEALAAEQRLGTDPSIGIWTVRSNIAVAQGHADEAVEHAGQAVALARARGEPARLAGALAASALAHTLAGDKDGAVPDAEEVVVLTHRLPNPGVVRNALALAALALGDSQPQRALALAREAVELSAPAEANIAWAIAGELAARYGDRRDALASMAKGVESSHWLGNRIGLGTLLGSVAGLLAESDPEATAVLLGAGDAIAPGFTHAPRRAEATQHAIEVLDASLGAPRRHELYAQGAAMNDADAVAYATAAIARSLTEEQV